MVVDLSTIVMTITLKTIVRSKLVEIFLKLSCSVNLISIRIKHKGAFSSVHVCYLLLHPIIKYFWEQIWCIEMRVKNEFLIIID